MLRKGHTKMYILNVTLGEKLSQYLQILDRVVKVLPEKKIFCKNLRNFMPLLQGMLQQNIS